MEPTTISDIVCFYDQNGANLHEFLLSMKRIRLTLTPVSIFYTFVACMAKIQSKKNSTKKEVIIEKASRLFREKGFGAASMRDLAEHVWVEAASLYNHIQSKSEILQTICFRVANKFMTNLETVESSPQSTLKKMEHVIRLHIRMMLDQYEFVYIADHEWRHLPEPYLSNFLSQRRSYRKRFGNIIEDDIRRGEMKDIDPYVAVLTILSAIS